MRAARRSPVMCQRLVRRTSMPREPSKHGVEIESADVRSPAFPALVDHPEQAGLPTHPDLAVHILRWHRVVSPLRIHIAAAPASQRTLIRPENFSEAKTSTSSLRSADCGEFSFWAAFIVERDLLIRRDSMANTTFIA